jgi:Zn-dependent protease with chaperone function
LLDFTPDIFVKNDKELTAYTGGVKEPYIVIHDECLKTLSDEEITSIVGHEMGHIMSGHVLYNSMMNFVVDLTVSKAPRGNLLLNSITLPVIGIALKPLELALAAWSRKSELTADRAGLLALQNVEVCHRLELKLAGFDNSSDIDLDDLYKQAVEYDSYNSALDNLYKLNNYGSHPDSIIRIKELEIWVSSGKYQEILNGNYLQRNGLDTKLVANENKKFCGNCGQKIPQVKFCPYCGSKI